LTSAAAKSILLQPIVVPKFRNYLIFLPAVSGDRHGRSRSARGAGLDTILSCGVKFFHAVVR